MVKAYNDTLEHPPLPLSAPLSPSDLAMPCLAYGSCNTPLPKDTPVHIEIPKELSPGWHTLSTPIFFLYAGKLPWMSRDVMMFPPAGSDGLIDLAIVGPTTRLDALAVRPPLSPRSSTNKSNRP